MRRSELSAVTHDIGHGSLSDPLTHRIKTVAQMLGRSEQSIRGDEREAGLDVRRSKGKGPAARLFSVKNVFELAAYLRQKSPPPRLIPDGPAVMTVYGLKGGTGKTVLAQELGVLYELMGYHVLLIDLDQRGCLSSRHGYDPELEGSDDPDPDSIIRYHFGHLFALPPLLPEPVALSEVIKLPYGPHGPHLVPADTYLSNLDCAFLNSRNRHRKVLNLIRNAAENSNEKLDFTPYDIIIFDAAPVRSVLIDNALLASQTCLAPVKLNKCSFRALTALAASLQAMKEEFRFGPTLQIVPTFYSEGHDQVTEALERLVDEYQKYLTDSMIRDTEHVSVSGRMVARPMPVSLSHPMSDVVRRDFSGLARDLLVCGA